MDDVGLAFPQTIIVGKNLRWGTPKPLAKGEVRFTEFYLLMCKSVLPH